MATVARLELARPGRLYTFPSHRTPPNPTLFQKYAAMYHKCAAVVGHALTPIEHGERFERYTKLAELTAKLAADLAGYKGPVFDDVMNSAKAMRSGLSLSRIAKGIRLITNYSPNTGWGQLQPYLDFPALSYGLIGVTALNFALFIQKRGWIKSEFVAKLGYFSPFANFSGNAIAVAQNAYKYKNARDKKREYQDYLNSNPYLFAYAPDVKAARQADIKGADQDLSETFWGGSKYFLNGITAGLIFLKIAAPAGFNTSLEYLAAVCGVVQCWNAVGKK